MTLVIKNIRNRLYYYEQYSYRSFGKVKTVSRYLGPVSPKRVKKGNVGFVVFGLLGLGISKATGQLKEYTPKAKLSSHPRSSLTDAWKPDTLAVIQSKARASVKETVIDKAALEEIKEFNRHIHSHPPAPSTSETPQAPHPEAPEVSTSPDAASGSSPDAPSSSSSPT